MTVLEELGRLVQGVDRAERWARDRAREYIDHDRLNPDAALRWVLEQAAAGDPLVLASPGQVWRLPDDVDPEEIDAPARVLLVYERFEGPARVDVRLLGEGSTPGTRDEVMVDVLRDYTLTTWMWWNDLEDTAASETGETCEETTAHRAPDDGAR